MSLKAKSGELVLEKFFKDYITVWYQERTVDVHTWDKARKEIDLLKVKKCNDRKKKNAEPLKTKDEDIRDVRSLPGDLPAKHAKGVEGRPNSSQSASSSKGHVKGQQSNQREREKKSKETYTKEEVEFQRVLEENFRMNKKVSEMKEELQNSRAREYIETAEREKQLEKLKKALENSRAQVDDLTIRLSKLAGDKLRDENPSLADLSDPDRPTELGKRFSEIYDNEWSDAFENIAIDEEEKKVGILHGMVMKAFSFCERMFEDQPMQIRNILLGLTQTTATAVPDGVKTTRTTQIHNILKDLRKQMSRETAGNVANEFLSATFEQYISGFKITQKKIPEKLRDYAKKCVELCWLMVVCDPPMVLSEDKEGTAFDINVYKPYTKSVRDMKQPVVKLHVWPALLLHVKGPLVAKGVAQPRERNTK